MRKLIVLVAGLFMISGVFAYTPTQKDQQLISGMTQKIYNFLDKHPSKEKKLGNKIIKKLNNFLKGYEKGGRGYYVVGNIKKNVSKRIGESRDGKSVSTSKSSANWDNGAYSTVSSGDIKLITYNPSELSSSDVNSLGWNFLKGGSDPELEWGCYKNNINGDGGLPESDIDGNGNTQAIVDNGCAGENRGEQIAARFCDGLVIEGKSDWYLPAKEELDVLYSHSGAIGGFPSRSFNSYWSSTEDNSRNVRKQKFSDGEQVDNYTKSNTFYVRCVRQPDGGESDGAHEGGGNTVNSDNADGEDAVLGEQDGYWTNGTITTYKLGNPDGSPETEPQKKWLNAKSYCGNMKLGGKSDWYLPSKDEINVLYSQRSSIGGYQEGRYWSFTEKSEKEAYIQDIASGGYTYSNKDNTYSVRCVRKADY